MRRRALRLSLALTFRRRFIPTRAFRNDLQADCAKARDDGATSFDQYLEEAHIIVHQSDTKEGASRF